MEITPRLAHAVEILRNEADKSPEMNSKEQNQFTVGTKKVVQTTHGWKVACATCDSATGLTYGTKQQAMYVATRLSAQPCQARACGAR